jgi:phosphoglycolate phosphatase
MNSVSAQNTTAVIFDLDGTLIESAPSILLGLEITIKKFGLLPVLPLEPCLIGPPLRDTLKKLVGDQANVDFDVLASDFMAYYDTEGYRESKIYPGIQELLIQLTQSNIALYLATNKRLEPTLKIVDYFAWTSFFDGIYAIDKFADAPFSNKGSMIHALIQAESIEKVHTKYIGDRIEDHEASSANGIEAILVKWGYGNLEDSSTICGINFADSPQRLYQMIAGTK